MGIRLKKALGYGIALSTQELKEQVNLANLDIAMPKSLAEYKASLSASSEHTDSEMLLRYWIDKNLEKREIADFVHLEKVSKENFALVIIPIPMISEWLRWDNSIDYVEYELKFSDGRYPQQSEITWLPYAPYPYSGLYMDAISGERISQYHVDLWKFLKDNKDTENGALVQRLLDVLEVSSLDEADNRIVPHVPEEVRNFIEWLGLFKNPDQWKSLRPVLGSFWG